MISRERTLWNRIRRRFTSSRASVYLEYAIVMPLAILLISTLIEFAAFWDAKVMANHTAWTCARIASVEAGQKAYDSGFEVNRLRTDGMKTATALLMSTCAMGSMHGASSEFTRDWFKTFILEPLEQLRQSFVSTLSKGITKALTDLIGKSLGIEGVIAEQVEKVISWIADSFLQPLVDSLVGVVTSFFDPLFAYLGQILDGNRLLRQVAYAAGRVKEFPNIITVTERKDMAFAKGASALDPRDTRLDLPRCLDRTATCDDWFVTSDAPWPPQGQAQRMIDVRIAWPFERAWLFPVLSTARLSAADAKSLDGVPTAVGRALFYPQPIISNDNLKSEGATAYDPGNTNKVPEVVDKIQKKYIGFLKVAALYYHYQLGDEEIGPYDSNSRSSYSYKGIGLGISGSAEKSKYYTDDGLVFWMGRAPADTGSHKDWKNPPPPADYLRCFRNVTGTGDETCLFWKGIAFAAFKYEALERLENHAYWSREWLCWGDGDEHLRIKNPTPEAYAPFLQAEEVRATYMVSPERTWDVSESEYAGDGRAPYDAYCRMRDQAPRFFASCARAMIDTCRADQLAACESLERSTVERFQKTFPPWREQLLTLVRNCSRELDEALGFGKKDNPGADPGTFIDVGMSDEEIMKDPEKAAEIIERKLEELKQKVFPAIREVDRTERELRQFGTAFPQRIAALVAARRQNLKDFAISVGQSILESGGADVPEAVRTTLRQNHAWGGEGPIAGSRDFAALADDYWAKFNANYAAQVALAKLLNCKAGGAAPTPRPDDPNPPLPPPGPDPDRPAPSTSDSGSDSDNGGDSWTRGTDGWRNDGRGAD